MAFCVKWYNVEVTKNQSFIFKDFLRYHNISFEPSSAGDLIHFEIFIKSKADYDRINIFLSFLSDF